VVVLALAIVALGDGEDRTFTPSWVATARDPRIEVFAMRGGHTPSLVLESDGGAPLVFLIQEAPEGATSRDGEWLHVYLPVRPNGSAGWLRASDVVVKRNDYRVTVDLSRHELTLSERGDTVLTSPIGVGTRAMPTPGGVYYIKELVEPPDADDMYGPYAFGLSGYSDSPGAAQFRGGDGVVGIHGTNDPSSIGKDVSHGCIRVPNDVVRRMATMLPLGTPVEIA
jgi:lipoprotein-anchoring transpeptidase ErfK/SrfK